MPRVPVLDSAASDGLCQVHARRPSRDAGRRRPFAPTLGRALVRDEWRVYAILVVAGIMAFLLLVGPYV